MDRVRPQNGERDAIYAGRVDATLTELQRMVREHEVALNRLRASSGSNQAREAANRAEAPFQIMTAAYDDLSIKTPFLPATDSILPALLALRKTHQTAEETKAYLVAHGKSAENAKMRLEVEKSNLQDQQALSQSLQARIQALQDGLDSRMAMGPEDIARERVAELKQKRKNYDQETSQLLKAVRKFIDDHLSSMLAAEELGGPVVGDLMEIDNDDLAAGFSAQGKLKKASQNPDLDRRQRRIDEIWGARQEQHSKVDSQEDQNETTAAGSEMRSLTEELLNSLAEYEQDDSTAYVQLHKESAAARFLVRSKVAKFHPRDSTKLRLIDFGRELDD